MSKVVDLTGLSRAITKIKEWVLGQRTHYGVEKSFGAEDIRTLNGHLSFEGYAKYALIDIVLSGLETTIKLNRSDDKTISYIESYNNYNVTLYLDWREDYTQIGYTDISWEIRVEDNFPLNVEDWEIINVVVPQKLLPEGYIPDTIARQSEIERLETAISNIEDKIDTTSWTDLSVSDTFEINTGGHIKVKKSGDNVSISLYNLKGKTTDTDVANICVLPDGYQPKYNQYFTCKIGLKTFATIVVTTYGSVNIDKIVLDGVQISPFDMGNLYFSCMFLI